MQKEVKFLCLPIKKFLKSGYSQNKSRPNGTGGLKVRAGIEGFLDQLKIAVGSIRWKEMIGAR